MTLRFICKVVAIFVLTGLPFAYYFQALRMDSEHYAESMMHRNFLWTSVVVTVLFVAYGIFVAGTPMTGRAERFDEQRLSDLRSIENEILNEVWGVNRGVMTSPPPTKLPKPLPNTLEDVAANAQYQKLRIADPETNIPYEYFPSDTTYQLCAVFTLTRDLSYDIFWNHGVGRTCFTINALEQQVK